MNKPARILLGGNNEGAIVVGEVRREAIVLRRPGGRVLVLGRVGDPRPRSRRRRPPRAGRLDIKDWLTGSTRHDWALTIVTGFVVMGTIFFGFSLASWLFGGGRALSFWLMGLGFWVLAFGVFFLFLDDPYPKHRRYR